MNCEHRSFLSGFACGAEGGDGAGLEGDGGVGGLELGFEFGKFGREVNFYVTCTFIDK